jgi:release factor glutamine methyltransferase
VQLKTAGIEEYEIDARLLLEHVLGITRTQLLLRAESSPAAAQVSHYTRLLNRRIKREPVAYILGEQEFWSLPFAVTSDVLIPRPETEFLLEQVLKCAQKSNFLLGKIADLCCGSGIIATILARETQQKIYAVDISAKALRVARQNIERHGQAHRVLIVQSDMFEGFAANNQFSLVVSNPPYVSHVDVTNNLAPEVSSYEPHLALDGGVRGLELIKIIRAQLDDVLMPGGEVFMEIGADQGRDVAAFFEQNTKTGCGFETVSIRKDYAGRDRVLHAIKKER